MDIEFVDAQPEPLDEPEDLLTAGRPRRLPRWIGTAVLALVVAAGGLTWLASRPADSPARPVASPSSRPAPVPVVHEDVLAGCPDTLACDATHQMQQHQIDMIRKAMLQRGKHRSSDASWTAGFNSGGTMVR